MTAKVMVTKGAARQPWEPMSIEDAGRLIDVIKGGGGKLSTVGGDPGDTRKQSGTG